MKKGRPAVEKVEPAGRPPQHKEADMLFDLLDEMFEDGRELRLVDE